MGQVSVCEVQCNALGKMPYWAGCVGALLHRADVFAGMYEGSELKSTNDAELDSALQQRSTMRAETTQELSITRETVTPWWFGLFVMLRVRPCRHESPLTRNTHARQTHEVAAACCVC
jgi:hypothetical protein